MEPAEDSEWEYEYDDAGETEDFYFTLDLSNLPQTQPNPITTDDNYYLRHIGGRRSVLLHNRLRVLGSKNAPQNPSTGSRPTTASSGVEKELQITGLHTSNPLILYQGQLLSCKWANTIGTDMLFVKPPKDAEQDAEYAPLRSLPDIDLLGISATKLVATEATLKPKDEVFGMYMDLDKTPTPPVPAPAPAPAAMEHTGQTLQAEKPSKENNQSASASQTRIEEASIRTADDKDKNSSNFFARLNQAKEKRGEKSRIKTQWSEEGPKVFVEHEERESQHSTSPTPQRLVQSERGGDPQHSTEDISQQRSEQSEGEDVDMAEAS